MHEPTQRLSELARRTWAVADRARDRLALSWQGVAFVAVAVLTVAAAGAVLLGLGEDVFQHNGLATSDPAHLSFFTTHRPHALVEVARSVTELGGVAVLGTLALAAGVVLWRRGAQLLVALSPLLALVAAAGLASLGKAVVGRMRPPASVQVVPEHEASFPSGHATDSTALFVALGLVLAAVLLRRPLLRVLSVLVGVAIAGLVGLSRLVLGVHWPTDVLAGWALGVVVATTVVTGALLIARVDWRHPADGSRPSRTARLLGFLTATRPTHRLLAAGV